MTVGFHPLANQELTEAGQFYEGRAEGLGSRFLDAVERAVQLLEAHPELGRPLSKTIRSLPVSQFRTLWFIAPSQTGCSSSPTSDVVPNTGPAASVERRHNQDLQLTRAPTFAASPQAPSQLKSDPLCRRPGISADTRVADRALGAIRPTLLAFGERRVLTSSILI